ncbi:MAG: hypothetical protein AABY32_04285 [Nanoarchaeota archaeon]
MTKKYKYIDRWKGHIIKVEENCYSFWARMTGLLQEGEFEVELKNKEVSDRDKCFIIEGAYLTVYLYEDKMRIRFDHMPQFTEKDLEEAYKRGKKLLSKLKIE